MLEAQKVDGRWHLKLNFSSLDLLQTCHRKSHYALDRNLTSEGSAPALSFGSSIHKALEHWHTLPADERELSSHHGEQAALLAHGHGLQDVRTGAMESLRQFVLRGFDDLSMLPETDKRSLTSGIKILRAYFKTYANDGYEVLTDAKGPMVEREFQFTMIEDEQIKVEYFGTIDLIFKHRDTGVIMVADHKTTSALGAEFYNRIKPNHQYTGYVMGAQRALGIETNLFMVNGLQVASTKQAFARQITERNKPDFDQLVEAVRFQALSWARAQEAKVFVQSAPNPCANYGGCLYHKICELPESLKENVILANWPEAEAQSTN